MKFVEPLVEAIILEIQLRAGKEKIQTIYFGGGTPSVLSLDQMRKIMSELHDNFDTSALNEVTFEVNPEDINTAYLKGLKQIGINRLSIGVQSFFDEDLIPMNRIHNATEARQSIEMVKAELFDSITIDLIYGIPWAAPDHFQKNLDLLVQYDLPHLSAYALTVEPKTALAHQIQKGKQVPVDDNQAFEEFQYLQAWAAEQNYEHYEISNLCQPNKRSLHNSNYWKGIPYLGFGPAAHSYDGKDRSWNISNNKKYIDQISNQIIPSEKESLSSVDRYNEWIMTGLRHIEGIAVDDVKNFNSSIQEVFYKEVKEKINQGILKAENGRLILNNDQRFFADGHSSDLFYIDKI